MGGWSQFANHGTVNPSDYQVYNQDHHGPALRVFESAVRREARVPTERPVVDVYGNGNEGDQSAGLDGQGPAVADRVGRAEADAMLRAWREAGTRLQPRLHLDLRWTRICFCGQQTAVGPVDDQAVPGIPFLTGSEEGRGPLYDVTRVPFEGLRSPTGFDSQGHKLGLPVISESSYPKAVPLFVVRIGERLIASVPGEATVEVGRRIRAAVLRTAEGTGATSAVLAGLTNEFIQYLTTPEEYDRQHYEGGSTMYGRAESVLVTEQLAELSRRMARGEPAQDAYPFDPRNGITANGEPFGTGAESGRILEQPVATPPGGQAVLVWQGGPRGLDRPLDAAFLTVERRDGARWRWAADDLGLQLVWTVDGEGRYRAHWQVPVDAPAGEYRIRVTANRYPLESATFRVDPVAPRRTLDPTHPAARFAPVAR